MVGKGFDGNESSVLAKGAYEKVPTVCVRLRPNCGGRWLGFKSSFLGREVGVVNVGMVGTF